MIALKTMLNDIIKAHPESQLTTKKMRVILRKEMSKSHDKNTSWTFTQAQYDKARSLFDPDYAKRLERSEKRAAKVKPEAPVEG